MNEIEGYLKFLSRAEIIRRSLDRFGFILVADTMDEAVEAVNEIAPEHLEIETADPFLLMAKVKNAGAIFVGPYSSEPLGDYFAGPNHTLPTSGTARYSSPLSVDDFVKKTQFLYYTEEALLSAGDKVARFARQEGLEAHARSVTLRMEDKT